jgi:hypothetical protein
MLTPRKGDASSTSIKVTSKGNLLVKEKRRETMRAEYLHERPKGQIDMISVDSREAIVRKAR